MAALSVVVLGTAAPAARAGRGAAPDLCNLTTTSRIVAVGDVHGAFDRFVAILQEAKVIDNRRRWAGGAAVLVQLGDVLDRGDKSREALDLIRKLEGEARKAGGQVVFLLGNHEVMRMLGDLRYVSPAEYDAFKSSDAYDLRERLYERALADQTSRARAKSEPFDAREYRKRFLAETPLGSVEMQIAFSESGEYGRWLREHDIMARVNGIAFVHGGPSARAAEAGCAGTNERARADLKTARLSTPDLLKMLMFSPEGPLWYRGLVGTESIKVDDGEVGAVLTALGATSIVVGHTVSPSGRIRSLSNGRVFSVDTGMLGGKFYPAGVPAALEINNGTFTAIYEGKREVLTPSAPR